MKLAYSWLSDFTDINVTRKEFAEKMTMSGSKVEGIHCAADEIKGVTVGKILSITPHKNADKLSVCTVDVGRILSVVTGATNINTGDFVPVACDGAKLPGGKTIKSGELRGVLSEGMLCSLSELGLTKNDFPLCSPDGIMILPDEINPVVGADICDVLGLNDLTIEFEITPNRSDCLSVRGLAREAAVTFDLPCKEQPPLQYEHSGEIHSRLAVKIDTHNCSRYASAIVDNVKIRPSPVWLCHRLRVSGIRPINNIVDITNYICLLYGHPMHAFDTRFVNGAQITVRPARDNEEIITLDGITRRLNADMTVIADQKGAVAVAGVMGGELSGIYEDTTSVILEAACFDGPNIRTTSKALGLRTESSARFEKGLSAENALSALYAALDLVKSLDAGDIVTGIIDIYPTKPKPRQIEYSPQKINRLLGVDITKDRMDSILTALDFTVCGDFILVPYSRYDVKLTCDIAEEIARFYGYNNLPAIPLMGVAVGGFTERQIFDEYIKERLLGFGLYECLSFSFYSRRNFDMLRLSQDDPLRDAIEILNPLGEDTAIMRTTAIPSILTAMGTNYSTGTKECRIFEYATEYIKNNNSELPDEPKKIVIALCGETVDFFTLKGIISALFAAARVDNITVEANTEISYLHCGRTADFICDGRLIATTGEVHPETSAAFGIKTRCYIADINLDLLFILGGKTPQYRPLVRYPSTSRDICILADKNIMQQEIADIIKKAAGRLLCDLVLFDVFESDKLPKDKRSLAYSLKLQSHSGTLTDKEADEVIKSVLTELSPLGVTLR